uniref:Ig-like domain-containing protein n=1 Tax=Varanus komodoensis TaxID=61221 RepID=A0A8D2JA40_VARKO
MVTAFLLPSFFGADRKIAIRLANPMSILPLSFAEAFPPTFLTRPESITTFVGKNARFFCTVSGTPVIETVWQKDGSTISSTERSRISASDNKHSLEIARLTVNDRGIYTCKASNKFGADICQMELAIIDKPRFIKELQSVQSAVNKKIRLEYVTALAGDTVFLQAVVRGSTPISVTWMKGKDIINEDNKVKITFENGLATLQISDVQISSGGKYTCLAENDAGSQTCFGQLAVKGQKPSPVDTLKGTEVSLECEISGTPPFDVTWYKDKRQIRTSKKYKVTAKNYHASVHILNVEAADIGEYQCKAQNDVGSDTCICTVKLKGKFCLLDFRLIYTMQYGSEGTMPKGSWKSRHFTSSLLLKDVARLTLTPILQLRKTIWL